MQFLKRRQQRRYPPFHPLPGRTAARLSADPCPPGCPLPETDILARTHLPLKTVMDLAALFHHGNHIQPQCFHGTDHFGGGKPAVEQHIIRPDSCFRRFSEVSGAMVSPIILEASRAVIRFQSICVEFFRWYTVSFRNSGAFSNCISRNILRLRKARQNRYCISVTTEKTCSL